MRHLILWLSNSDFWYCTLNEMPKQGTSSYGCPIRTWLQIADNIWGIYASLCQWMGEGGQTFRSLKDVCSSRHQYWASRGCQSSALWVGSSAVNLVASCEVSWAHYGLLQWCELPLQRKAVVSGLMCLWRRDPSGRERGGKERCIEITTESRGWWNTAHILQLFVVEWGRSALSRYVVLGNCILYLVYII